MSDPDPHCILCEIVFIFNLSTQIVSHLHTVVVFRHLIICRDCTRRNRLDGPKQAHSAKRSSQLQGFRRPINIILPHSTHCSDVMRHFEIFAYHEEPIKNKTRRTLSAITCVLICWEQYSCELCCSYNNFTLIKYDRIVLWSALFNIDNLMQIRIPVTELDSTLGPICVNRPYHQPLVLHAYVHVCISCCAECVVQCRFGRLG